MAGGRVEPLPMETLQAAVWEQLRARRAARSAKEAWASAPSPAALALLTERAREELRSYAGLVAALGYDGTPVRALADLMTADDRTWWFLVGRIIELGSEVEE